MYNPFKTQKNPQAYTTPIRQIIGDRSFSTPQKKLRVILYLIIILLTLIILAQQIPLAIAESIPMPRHDSYYLRFVRPYTSEVCNTAVNKQACYTSYHITNYTND